MNRVDHSSLARKSDFGALKDDLPSSASVTDIEASKPPPPPAKTASDLISDDDPFSVRLNQVFQAFYPLGFVAFGGPQAHIAILHNHLVVQRKWLDEESFLELFAIGQGLPGPTSTQLVVSTAMSRAGIPGGLLALFMWNLPGFIFLTTAGMFYKNFWSDGPPFYLSGLAPAAISLVFQASYGFAQSLDSLGKSLALISACVSLLINTDNFIPKDSAQWVYPCLLLGGCLTTLLDSKRPVDKRWGTYKTPKGWGGEVQSAEDDLTFRRIGISLKTGAGIFMLWLVILVACAAYAPDENEGLIPLFQVMYKTGSLIFGGGQVVLPLLYSDIVSSGWLRPEVFYQGFALASALPGPLFNFSAFVGAAYKGLPGAVIAYLGLFAPGVILIFAVCPYWATLRHKPSFKVLLSGLNSTAIGFIFSACVFMFQETIKTGGDAIVFCIAGGLSVGYKIGAPFVIIIGGIVGALLNDEILGLGQQEFGEENIIVEGVVDLSGAR